MIATWEHLANQKYKHAPCRKAARAYTANLLLCHSLTLIPGFAFLTGGDWDRCFSQAASELKTDSEKDAPTIARARELLGALREQRGDELKAFHVAKSNVEIQFSEILLFRNALDGLLKSMTIMAWTAFEVLAEDLLRGIFEARPSLDVRKTWKGDKRNAANFRSRSKIANYYRWTFDVDNAEILSVVDNSAVHALAILRNSIVHNGGRIDLTFQDDRKGLFKGIVNDPKNQPRFPIPELTRIKGRAIGYKIPFTGDMMRAFVDPVTPLGFGLVKAVDEWLTTHR